MFESLSEKIDSALHRLSGRSKISDINIAEAVKDIRRALVDADVNYKLAKDFTDRIKERAMGQDVLKSLEPGQLMVKIVRDEIAELMGGTASELASGTGLQTVLMAGLQGSGTYTVRLRLTNSKRLASK
jgi:signal recognition particle subunit SRP54